MDWKDTEDKDSEYGGRERYENYEEVAEYIKALVEKYHSIKVEIMEC